MRHLLKALVISALLLAGASSRASSEDHDHESFPEGTLLALEGRDAITQEECLLFVTDVGYTGAEETADQFYAVVQTSYSHNQDHPQVITVKAKAQKPDILTGLGENGQDQIALFLPAQVAGHIDLRNVNSFNLRWLHGNHFHTSRCINLVVHED